MISLTMFLGDREVRRFVIDKQQISIGRMSNNDICLDNIGISKLHARIFETTNHDYLLEDCGSTNGTYHNGKLVKVSQVLEKGDVIGIVKYDLVVSAIEKSVVNSQSSELYPKTFAM